jgi:hypothetical protein
MAPQGGGNVTGDADTRIAVEVLRELEQIRTVEARYARYADEKRSAAVAGLFTPDGTFTSHNVDGSIVADMSGRREIGDRLATMMAGDVTLIHMLFTSEIDVASETSAHAVWAMADLIFRGDDVPAEVEGAGSVPAFRTMRGWGHYHVDYEKTDGAWYISRRVQTRTRLEFRN